MLSNNQGKFNEANQAHDKAIELDHAIAWQGKGYALKLLGKTSESNAAWEKPMSLKKCLSNRLPIRNQMPKNAGLSVLPVMDLVEQ